MGDAEITMQQNLKQCFDKDGYVVLPGFLSPEEVAELRREIARYIIDVAPRLPASEVFYEIKGQPATLKQLQRMFEHDEWFQRFFFSDRFVKLAETLMGDAVVGKNLQWFNKQPGVSLPTPPHQDGFYFMLEPNEAVTMWLALDEVDEANGCVRYVPGSHRRGLRHHERTDTLGFSQGIPDYHEDDRRRERAMAARPGDLLAHHALTIHRADANASARTRRALGFIYYSSAAREDVARKAAYQQAIAAEWATEGKL
jgi:phytanoyl-CoA hydroxylase